MSMTGFDGYYNDSYDPYAVDDYSQSSPYASMFFSPQQIAMQQALLGGYGGDMGGFAPDMFGITSLPQLDTKGRQQPEDLGTAMQRLNFGQDIGTSMTNPFMAYAGGAGSYAPGALNPTREEEILQLTQGPQLQMMAQSGGIRGTIADLILGGMNSGQATARVREMLKNPEQFADVITPAEAAQMRSELDIIPADPMNGVEESPDFNSISKIADSIYNPYLAEQAMLQQPDIEYDPVTGRAVRVTEKDSPTMEFLKKAGLPDPRARYDLEFALQNDPALSTLMQTTASTQDERDMIRSQFDERLKRIDKRREQREKDAEAMERYTGQTAKWAMDRPWAKGQERAPVATGVDALRPALEQNWIAQGNAVPGGAASAPMSREQQVIARNTTGFYGLPGVDDPAAAGPVPDGGGINMPDVDAGGLGKAWDIASGAMRPGKAFHGAADFIEGIGKPDSSINPDWGQMWDAAQSSMEPGKAISDIAKHPGKLAEMAKMAAIPGYGIKKIFGGGGDDEEAAGPNPFKAPGVPSTGEQYSLMEQMLGKPARDKHRAMVDEAVPLNLQRLALHQKRRGLEGRGTEAAWQYAMRLAPIINAARRGQTPAGDAVQQRMAPLYAMGALGNQRGF